MSNPVGIPSVDLKKFTHGTPEEKAEFVKELGEAYETVGFVAVKNHGIDQELINKLYDYTQNYFVLPLDVKEKHEIPGLAGQRGYTSFGREQAKGSEVPDLKEFFQYGQTVENADSKLSNEYPPNVIVGELDGFNDTFFAAYRNFEKSGKALLSSIALFLGLEENYFDQYVNDGNSILRAIHYPPITQEPKSAIRAEQHEDINLITLLVGASADGLEVLNKQGEWVAVKALDDQIVVNVGDMLQRFTNNRLRSTTHRVVNPPKEKWHTSRFSIPFFLHPVADMKLDCLESCVTESNPIQYEPITAGEYLDERLREIGLKK